MPKLPRLLIAAPKPQSKHLTRIPHWGMGTPVTKIHYALPEAFFSHLSITFSYHCSFEAKEMSTGFSTAWSPVISSSKSRGVHHRRIHTPFNPANHVSCAELTRRLAVLVGESEWTVCWSRTKQATPLFGQRSRGLLTLVARCASANGS